MDFDLEEYSELNNFLYFVLTVAGNLNLKR